MRCRKAEKKNIRKELGKTPKPQVPPTRCPLPSLLSPPVISSPLHPPSSSPFPPGTLLSSSRSCILVFGVFLSCRKFLMLSIMQPALASPALPGSPPKDSHVPDSQRRRHRSPPRNGIHFSLFALSFSFVFLFPLQLFSTLTLQNTPSPSAPRAEAAQLRPFPCLAFPSSSSSLRETAPDLILIRLRRCWSVILRERICTDIVFSAFSWPQARLSGLSATHCVAVTCGKRQPEPASQLLVATWKSSVHFLPSVCVCIINSVSLCELSIMYLNTCPSVNDVLRSTRAPGSAPPRGDRRCGSATIAPEVWHGDGDGIW